MKDKKKVVSYERPIKYDVTPKNTIRVTAKILPETREIIISKFGTIAKCLEKVAKSDNLPWQ